MGTIDLAKDPYTFISDLLPPEVPTEEVETIIRHLADKLPGETFERLGSTGSLKEKLRGFMNQHYRTMIVRYLAADTDENEPGMRRSSGEIVQLLRSMGGAGLFPTGEIERPLDAVRELETHTNRLLSQEAGSPLLGDNAYSVVKCVFRDNAQRPATVTDVKLAVILPDAELISPLFHYGAVSAYLIKDLISRQLIESIDREIAAAGGQAAEGQKLAERITGILSGDDPSGLNPAGLNPARFDSKAIRGQIMKSADFEHIRSRGFNAAVNALVSMLGNAQLDYQFLENGNGRELIIREYEDADPAGLPDERYQIRLKYFDEEQLIAERAAFDAQLANFEKAVQHLWKLTSVLYQDSKSIFKVNDFEDLAQKNKSRAGENAVEIDVVGTRAQLVKMRERIQKMYESLFPVERRVLEERLSLLEKEYTRREGLINPHHLQPGLLVDIDITSIKRKKTTLDSLAGVLNQFLREASGAFHDAASAVFAVPLPARQPEKVRRKRS